MSKHYIPQPLRKQLLAESKRCAYCHSPIALTGTRLVIDHIIPEAVGGITAFENLCLACHSCNEFKATRTAAIDPLSSQPTALFHPRQQQWHKHFRWSKNGGYIIGQTATGRVTVQVCNMNHPDIVAARLRWASVGWHPPLDDLPTQ